MRTATPCNQNAPPRNWPGQRLIAEVQLIKALGGGWNTQALVSQANSPTRH